MFALLSGSSSALQLHVTPRSPQRSDVSRVALTRMQAPQTDSSTDVQSGRSASDIVSDEVGTYFKPAAQALRQTQFRRAEFWNNGSATLFDVINVIGRFYNHEDFSERTDFLVVENVREEDTRQAGTKERFEMAKRNGCTERCALEFNAPKLPFKDEKLAASFGLTPADFDNVPLTFDAIMIVYDALAESRTSLLNYAICDARRKGWSNGDGSFNELAFRAGLYKGRALVIFSWFIFGKGNFVWILVAAQFLHDARPDLFPTPKELNLDKIGAFI